MNIWPKLRGNHGLVYLGDPKRNSGTQSPAPQPGEDASLEDDATDRKPLKPTPTSPMAPAPSIPAKKSNGSPKFIKPSIAAATIVGIIFVAGGVFLLVWYIRRERRARRLRGMQTGNQSQDPFCQSTLTLNEDSDRTLNEFLMKDLRPERTSLMFNNSHSPSSFTLFVNDTNHPSTSTNSLRKVDSAMTITPVITEESQPIFVVSDITETNTSSPTSPETPKESTTPPLSMASTAPSTERSSQLWTTTTGTTTTGTTTATVMTELSSLLDNPDPGSSRASQSTPRPTDVPPFSGASDLITHLSSSSRASSRYSRSVTRAKPRSIDEQRSERRERTSSHRRSESTVSSPMGEDLSAQSSSLPTIPPAPTPLFRLSEA